MADEIAQVCELEIKGVTILVNATLKSAQMIARMLRALMNYGTTAYEKNQEKKLNAAGKKDIDEIMLLSKDGPAQVLEIRESMLDEVIRIATEKGLHYAPGIDFIPSDGKFPIFIPAHEVAVWGAIFKAVVQTAIVEDEKVVDGYGKQIAEEKEKLLNAVPEEKEQIETRIENLTQAKKEAAEWVAYDQGVIDSSSKDVVISLTEYLKQSKGTEFESNPEKAMAELEKGVEIGPKISAKECFQPIRDKSYMPKSEVIFYVPEMGAAVTRMFKLDEETGLVYSDYALKTKGGEIHRFSDHNMTSAKWNESILPQMLDKAEILEQTECRMFDSQEKLGAYLKYHNNVKPQAEKNIERAIENGEQVFSSAESKSEIEAAISETKKGLASAQTVNNSVVISVDPSLIYRQDGKIALGLKNGETLMFSGMSNERIEKGQAVFEVSPNAEVLYLKHNGTSPEQSHTVLGTECKQIIENALATAGNPLQSNTQSHGR